MRAKLEWKLLFGWASYGFMDKLSKNDILGAFKCFLTACKNN